MEGDVKKKWALKLGRLMQLCALGVVPLSPTPCVPTDPSPTVDLGSAHCPATNLQVARDGGSAVSVPFNAADGGWAIQLQYLSYPDPAFQEVFIGATAASVYWTRNVGTYTIPTDSYLIGSYEAGTSTAVQGPTTTSGWTAATVAGSVTLTYISQGPTDNTCGSMDMNFSWNDNTGAPHSAHISGTFQARPDSFGH
jgi:hypothetical protein